MKTAVHPDLEHALREHDEAVRVRNERQIEAENLRKAAEAAIAKAKRDNADITDPAVFAKCREPLRKRDEVQERLRDAELHERYLAGKLNLSTEGHTYPVAEGHSVVERIVESDPFTALRETKGALLTRSGPAHGTEPDTIARC